MITLYTFGPYFGLPDGSPFVTKAMLLLKLAGLAYAEDRGGYGRAPKGKLPYINDDGVLIADSTFIRFHIEKKYGFDFDAGLDPAQKATGWAVERMCEDHLNWAMMAARWVDEANFAKGPTHFFDAIPLPIRPIVRSLVRRKVRSSLIAHGFGRHAEAEAFVLAKRDIDALATLLGDKAFLMGETPCAADATAFAFIAHLLSPTFDAPIRTAAERCANLVAYRDKIMELYFPAFA
jgi:glutathione S-transferase